MNILMNVLATLAGVATATLYWLWQFERARADAAEKGLRILGVQFAPSVAEPVIAGVPASLVPTPEQKPLPFAIVEEEDEPSPDGLELDFLVKKLEAEGMSREDALEAAPKMIEEYRRGGVPG